MTPNREDTMRMALEAGVRAAKLLGEFGTEGALCDSEIQDLRAVERLVQAAYAAGAAAEREAVLDLVDDYAKGNTDLRDAIRARGQA